jgi:hypothetical protein
MEWYQRSHEEVLAELATADEGLMVRAATAPLARYVPNALAAEER